MALAARNGAPTDLPGWAPANPSRAAVAAWPRSWNIAGVVILPNGQIVVGGNNGSAFELSRYNSNGTLDTTFGTNGTATLAAPLAISFAPLGLEADGKLVVGGSTNSGMEVARFNANGTLDTTFNSAGPVPGTVAITFAGSTGIYLRGLAIYPSTGTDTADYGKIEMAGEADYSQGGINSEDVALARCNADGTADSTFGQSGQVVTPIPWGGDDPRMKLQNSRANSGQWAGHRPDAGEELGGDARRHGGSPQ